MPRTTKIVFLLSYTGGGHKAVADALRDTFIAEYGESAFTFDTVDVFQKYCAPPFNTAPQNYAAMVNHTPYLWGMLYQAINGVHRAKWAARAIHAISYPRLRHLPHEHPADLVISTHSIITRPSFAVYRQRAPFLTVVSDLGEPPLFWYEPDVTACFVPTSQAVHDAIRCGIPPQRVHQVGLPIHPAFQNPQDENTLRQQYNLPPDKPIVLVVSGGEGMGDLPDLARSLATAHLDCTLLIVCGSNRTLQQTLSAQLQQPNVRILGFVDMPSHMAISDILITKAGPSTIMEAATMGLPVLLSGAIPGQEEGNIRFVEQHQFGLYRPDTSDLLDTLRQWLNDAATRQRIAQQARQAATPDAAQAIIDYAKQVIKI